MTGATVLLGRNALVFIEQMLRPARPSINCPGVHAERMSLASVPAAAQFYLMKAIARAFSRRLG
jgi:hypothetical protein